MKPRRPRPADAAEFTVEPLLRGLPLPPLRVVEPDEGWTADSVWEVARTYASRLDHRTATSAGIAQAAWLALSRGADHALGVSAASPRSVVHQEIGIRLRPTQSLDPFDGPLA
jgi:hypothetical protein